MAEDVVRSGRRGPHNSLLVTCLTYVRSPIYVSLDLICSFLNYMLPLSPLFSLLITPPVILGRGLNQLQNYSNSRENCFLSLEV